MSIKFEIPLILPFEKYTKIYSNIPGTIPDLQTLTRSENVSENSFRTRIPGSTDNFQATQGEQRTIAQQNVDFQREI